MKRRGIQVTVCDAMGRRLPTTGLSRWLERVAPARARGEVSVALVSDTRIRALNSRYRRKDAPTDVLSFPAAVTPAPRAPDLPFDKLRASRAGRGMKVGPAGTRCLGDIVIARGVARRQARAAGHDEETELRVLALHGLLHLLGFDHHVDDGRMARTERRLRRKGGLREGLIERAHQ